MTTQTDQFWTLYHKRKSARLHARARLLDTVSAWAGIVLAVVVAGGVAVLAWPLLVG